jgi:hypothetical protein
MPRATHRRAGRWDRGRAPRAASAARRGLALGKATRSARPMRASASSRLFRWPLPGRRAAGWAGGPCRAGARPAGQARMHAAPPSHSDNSGDPCRAGARPAGQACGRLSRRAWAPPRPPTATQAAGSRAQATAVRRAQAQPGAGRRWWAQTGKWAQTRPERRGLAMGAAGQASASGGRGARGAHWRCGRKLIHCATGTATKSAPSRVST